METGKDVKEGYGKEQGGKKWFERVQPLIEGIVLAGLVSLFGPSGLRAQEPATQTKTEQKTYVEVGYEEGTDILALMCGYGLMADALSYPDSVNSLKLGFAAHVFYSIANSHDKSNSGGAERCREFADGLLSQAIKIAMGAKQAYALMWLADIYEMDGTKKGRNLGVTPEEMRALARNLIDEGKAEPSYLLPSEYYKDNYGPMPQESKETSTGKQSKDKGVVKPIILPAELKPYTGRVPEGTEIVALQYANGLIADAFSDPNNPSPMKLALGAQIYIAAGVTVPEKDSRPAKILVEYGLSVLAQAANIATLKGDPYSLRYIADVYELIVGKPEKAVELREMAKTIQPRSVDYLLPYPEYYPDD